jgi:hypothetical protein
MCGYVHKERFNGAQRSDMDVDIKAGERTQHGQVTTSTSIFFSM